MRVNLLDEKKIKRDIRWDQIFIVLLVIFVFVLPAGHYYLNYLETQRLERDIGIMEDQLEVIEPQLEEYEDLQAQIAEFELPEEIEVTRYMLADPMQELGVIMPGQVTLESISYNDGDISVNGFASDIENILTLVQNFFDSDYYSVISLQRFQRGDVVDFNLEVSLETEEELPQ